MVSFALSLHSMRYHLLIHLNYHHLLLLLFPGTHTYIKEICIGCGIMSNIFTEFTQSMGLMKWCCSVCCVWMPFVKIKENIPEMLIFNWRHRILWNFMRSKPKEEIAFQTDIYQNLIFTSNTDAKSLMSNGNPSLSVCRFFIIS